MRDLMFAGVFLALLPASLMSAHAGVLVWVWIALLSPNQLLYGLMNGLEFNKIIATMTLGMIVIHNEKKDFYIDGTVLLLVLFALVATLSWSGGIVSNDDATSLYLKIIKEVTLAIVITAVMLTRQRLHLLVWVIVVSFAFLGVKEGLISVLTSGGHEIVGSGSIGDNNSLATALLMVVPLIYYLLNYSAVRAVRLAIMITLGLTVVTIVMTFSRGGFLGLLVLAGFMVKNSRNKLPAIMLVIVTAMLIYTLAPDTWFSRLSTIEDAGEDGSFMGRVVAWKLSWLIAADHPFFGGGMHAVQQFAVWTAYVPFIDQLDFIRTPPPEATPHAAHSIYFEVLGDMGFVGLIVFLSMAGAAVWNCRRIYQMSRGNPSLAWAADLARMLQISLVVYLVTAAALSMAYFELLYIVVALASRVHRTVKQSVAVERQTQAAPRDVLGRPIQSADRSAAFAGAPDRRADPRRPLLR